MQSLIQNLDEFFSSQTPKPFSETRRLAMTSEQQKIFDELAQKTDWKADTWGWIKGFSHELNPKDGQHASGHTDDTVSQATGALVLMTLIILTLSIVYLTWRVYYKKKYLTEYWIKEFGKSNRNSFLESPDKSAAAVEQPSLELAANIPASKKGPKAVDAAEVEVEFQSEDDAEGEEVSMESEAEGEESEEDEPQNSKLQEKQKEMVKLDKERSMKRDQDDAAEVDKSRKTNQEEEYYDEEEEEDEEEEVPPPTKARK